MDYRSALLVVSTFVLTAFVVPVQLARAELEVGDPTELQVEFTAAKRIYAIGETILAVATVSNPTSRSITVFFSSGCHWWFSVLDEGGRYWYDGPRGFACTAAATSRTLLPGEILILSYSWNQRDRDGNSAPSGAYVLRFEHQKRDPLLLAEISVLIVDTPSAESDGRRGEDVSDFGEPRPPPASLPPASAQIALAGALAITALGFVQVVPLIRHRFGTSAVDKHER